MKVTVIALVLCAGLGGCQFIKHPSGPDMGNPNHTAYAGEPASVYDRATNPRRNISKVTYSPDAPLPTNLPAYETLPPPASGPPAWTPPDITAYVQRRMQCNHWSGKKPYDKARLAEINRAVAKLNCRALDAG